CSSSTRSPGSRPGRPHIHRRLRSSMISAGCRPKSRAASMTVRSGWRWKYGSRFSWRVSSSILRAGRAMTLDHPLVRGGQQCDNLVDDIPGLRDDGLRGVGGGGAHQPVTVDILEQPPVVTERGTLRGEGHGTTLLDDEVGVDKLTAATQVGAHDLLEVRGGWRILSLFAEHLHLVYAGHAEAADLISVDVVADQIDAVTFGHQAPEVHGADFRCLGAVAGVGKTDTAPEPPGVQDGIEITGGQPPQITCGGHRHAGGPQIPVGTAGG